MPRAAAWEACVSTWRGWHCVGTSFRAPQDPEPGTDLGSSQILQPKGELGAQGGSGHQHLLAPTEFCRSWCRLRAEPGAGPTAFLVPFQNQSLLAPIYSQPISSFSLPVAGPASARTPVSVEVGRASPLVPGAALHLLMVPWAVHDPSGGRSGELLRAEASRAGAGRH